MKQSKNPLVWLPLAIAVALVLGLAAGLWMSRRAATRAELKMSQMLGLIANEYVDEVDLDSLVESTLPDLLSNLDPHSTYIPASELQAVNEDLDGSFSGIGISFTMMTDTIVVNEVIPGGPSEKIGLMAGDRIISINDSVVAGKNVPNTAVMKMLRGAKGSEVKLGVKRHNSKKLLTFNVVRGDIPVNSVDAAYIIAPATGYIKVNKFGRTTSDEFLTALANLRNEGAESYVVDLRGNGGGFLEMAIYMANEFLPARRPIVFTRGRSGMDDSRVFSDGTGSFSDAQLVVLLDEYSASASEIFAGALQDNDRALIVGRRSFGKGLVQRQTMLPDSSAVRLTVSRYYTPSGRCIQKDYKPGRRSDYDMEILDRYQHGELYSSDSIKFDDSLRYNTLNGRPVYGGGGIMPDVFVPNDTTGITNYYVNVVNAGLLQRFSFDYADSHRETLSSCKTLDCLLEKLPDDDELLQMFVSFAVKNGIPARWYYINISRRLIVNNLKALIASDILGRESYYKVYNTQDATVLKALEELGAGRAAHPIMPVVAAADSTTLKN